MYARIKDRGLDDKAFAHMKVLGDRKKRMIYAYEFPDHSVYVGLTFNYDKRDKEHKAKGLFQQHDAPYQYEGV